MKAAYTSQIGSYRSPENKTESDLQILVRLLTARYETEKIFCHGWIMTSEIRESCFAGESSSLSAQYFLLLATRKIYPEHEVQEYVSAHFDGAVHIVTHHIGRILKNLEMGSRFFTTVWNSGVLLYTADGNAQLKAYPEPDPQLILNKAEKHFKNRMELAKCFFESAERQYLNRCYNPTVFLLHQTMEQACIALIRVFLGYRANIHSLSRLLEFCRCFSNVPAEIFPRNNDEERNLFRIISKSYTEARYKDDFSVDEEDALSVLIRVCKFLEVSEKLCREQIASMRLKLESENYNLIV